eukprot:TRINITY_DN10799_c0_g1_i1.p1 TRINITY_DN10799_c0_g1~~TRINITY_DN10799_c0_g1_i1.p1  ORF type:complete len:852 (+),score=161.05 TRINITY_DN10799_c0_g1_i1:57-2612(+)
MLVIYILIVLGLCYSLFVPRFIKKIVEAMTYITLNKFVNIQGNNYIQVQEDITVSWLQIALRERYPNVVIDSVQSEIIGADMGNASTIYKLEIEYDENTYNLPPVMIIKTPKGNISNMLPFTAARMFEMETYFYTRISSEFKDVEGVLIPHCFGGKYCNKTGNFYIIMAPITGQFGKEKQPINNIEIAENAVRSIARFHAIHYNSERLDEGGDLNWVLKQDSELLGMNQFFIKHSMKPFLTRFGEHLPEELVSNLPKLVSIAQNIHDYCARGPKCLIQGDCHLENTYFVGEVMGIYDFQMFRIGNSMIDVSCYIGGSMDSDMLNIDNNEKRLIKIYLEELALNNPNVEINYEETYHMYKMCLLINIIWNISAVNAIPFDNECSVSDYVCYISRLSESVQRNDCIDYGLFILASSKKLNLRGKRNFEFPAIQQTNGLLPTEDIEVHQARISTPKNGILNSIIRYIKYKVMYKLTSSKKGHHGQKVTDLSDAYLEEKKSLDYAIDSELEDQAFDSYYFSCFSKDISLGLRLCKRINAGEIWIGISIKNVGVFIYENHPSTSCNVEYRGDRCIYFEDGSSMMEFICIEPMKLWKINFEGVLKHQETNEIVSAKFELDYNHEMPMFSFGTHVSPELVAHSLSLEPFSKQFFDELKASHQEHYEQFGSYNGFITLDQFDTYSINGLGMRDRAFGIRDWAYLQRYVMNYFYIKETNTDQLPMFICKTLASLPTITNGKFGFVYDQNYPKDVAPYMSAISGKLEELCIDGIPPETLTLTFESDGILYWVKIKAKESLGLIMGNHQMLVNWRFCKYKLLWVDPDTNEIRIGKGFGANEFGYRIKGALPVKPKSSLKPVG